MIFLLSDLQASYFYSFFDFRQHSQNLTTSLLSRNHHTTRIYLYFMREVDTLNKALRLQLIESVSDVDFEKFIKVHYYHR